MLWSLPQFISARFTNTTDRDEAAKVIRAASEAWQQSPGDLQIWVDVTQALIQMGKTEDAVRHLTNNYLSEDQVITVLRDVAGERRRAGAAEDMQVILSAAAAVPRADLLLHSDIVKEHFLAGHFEKGRAWIRSADIAPAVKTSVFRDLGGDFLAQGNSALALYCSQAARDLSPKDLDVQRELVKTVFAIEGEAAALEVAATVDFSLEGVYRHDFTPREKLIYTRVCDIAIASPELVIGLVRAADYVLRAKIPGDFVECGVFRGGSTMTMMLALLDHGVRDRQFYLYDTFTGFPLPDKVDLYYDGRSAIEEWHEKKRSETESGWLVSTLDETRDNVLTTGYPQEKITFVKGMVEDTIPDVAPETIAFLRLDTDFYESTKHELVELYSRISPGGILIIDDYGAFQGARQAVDEFFAGFERPPLLNRIDSNVRILVKDWTGCRDPGAPSNMK